MSLLRVCLALTICFLISGCEGDSSDLCRLAPSECDDGKAGAFCASDDDCLGTCCTEDSNCGGGMCTFTCAGDDECPDDMACEHGVCFYRCDDDLDCAEGQSCEHDNTVCEWP